MRTFKHYTGRSVEEAASLLTQNAPGARLVAGGTDLLGGLKDCIHPRSPETLIDLKRIEGLDRIEEGEDGLTLGAMVRLHSLETDPRVKKDYGLLAQAARSVASPQLRNMGTLGGNICQEPRCWYYRYPDNFFHCLRKGGDYCPALTGENRYHSIFGAARVGTTPCTRTCPASVNIPDYLKQLRAGDWDAAARILLAANPMPAVTGRVCPHFCQDECNRQELDTSVSIRSVERLLGDYILDNAERFYAAPDEESGHRAAVVGAGPGGLAAAYYLRAAGHGVTVFDRLNRAGGMLSHAIPAYRLPPAVVERFVSALEGMGVEFIIGREVGPDEMDRLVKEYEAVFAAPGAWGSPRLNIPGEELAGPALEFLTRSALGEKPAVGRRVAVIGGGNVAVDAGLTAKRLGAEEVTLVCLESREEMPAHEWEIAQAQEEGIELLPSWGPARIGKTGESLSLELIRCTAVFDPEGNFCPAYDQAETKALEADQVLLAVGQRCEPDFLAPGLLNKRGLIGVDAATQQTSRPEILAGGDAVTGPASVAGALASGARAAAGLIARWGERPEKAGAGQGLHCFSPQALDPSEPVREEIKDPARRTLVDEDAATVSPEEALAEAGRCFDCGCVAVSPADVPPALLALEATMVTSKREVPAEEFFRAVKMGSTALEPDEIVTGVWLPKASSGAKWGFQKFRIRKSIDFPMASVAVVLNLEGDKVVRARIALGAVAPTPLRARKAEAVLEGSAPTPEAARAAARAVVAEALPLKENEYKIDILKALVERTILAAARGDENN